MSHDVEPVPRFVALLRWLVNHPDGGDGSLERLASRAGASPHTLHAWDNGKFPTARSTRAVKDLDAWARQSIADYPPGRTGLVHLSGRQRVLDEVGPRRPEPELPVAEPPLATTTDSPAGPAGDETAPRRSRRTRTALLVGVLVAAVLAVGAGLALVVRHQGSDERPGNVVELSDNKKGVVVFGDQRGGPPPAGVADRIPYGTPVEVECVAEDESGIASVSALYRVASGPWKGMYAVSDSFTNGVSLGSSDGALVDPLIRKCP